MLMFYPFVVLDAGMGVGAARRRLARFRPPTRVVVRRCHWITVVWYVRPLAEIAERLRDQPVEMNLGSALALDQMPPAGALDIENPPPRDFAGVLLRGDEVVGVAYPDWHLSGWDAGGLEGPYGNGGGRSGGPLPVGDPPTGGGAGHIDPPPDFPATLSEEGGPSLPPKARRTTVGERVRAVGRRLRFGSHRSALPAPSPGGSTASSGDDWSEGPPGGGTIPATLSQEGGPEIGPRTSTARREAPLPSLPPPAAPPVESSFSAYPRLEAPRAVAVGERFTLEIGLSPAAQREVYGGPFDVPIEEDNTTFALEVAVVAEGFEAPEGWRRPLTGQVARFAEAVARIALIAQPGQGEVVEPRSLVVSYSHRGTVVGTAWRNLVVRPNAAAPAPGTAYLATLAGEEGTQPLGQSRPGFTPDLTVRIDKPDRNAGSGRFVWSFESPHGLELPAEPLPIDLGEDARTFAKTLIEQVEQNRGQPFLNNVFEELGRLIANQIPELFWDLLRQVHAIARGEGRDATILLLSAESYVPWELALVEPPLDPARPPLLGAQAVVGRWILGRRGPVLPPPDSLKVHRMAVVVGDYGHTARWRPLPFALEEGEELVSSYSAVRLKAQADELDALFEARLPGASPGAEAVHFACHGTGDPARLQAAIILEPDGRPLNYLAIGARRLGSAHRPFVFLNACQVGSAADMLGQYSGFSGVFLNAGASGFVAPLWSVDDQVAKQVATDFYRRAFGGEPVGSILRDLRSQTSLAAGAVPEATYLAYVFYGHPQLMLDDRFQPGEPP